MTFEPAFFDKATHALALDRACIAALEKGDIVTALRLTDRRCRIKPLAEAHHFTLRADLIARSGKDMALALADIRRALAIEPDHIAANRRLLGWGTPADKLAAAAALVKLDRDFSTLKKAIDCLASSGRQVVTSLRAETGTVQGWVAWQDRLKLELLIEGRGSPYRAALQPNPAHPLRSALGAAAQVVIRWPVEAGSARVSLLADGEPVTTLRVGRQFAQPPALRQANEAASSRITIIIPVYNDFEATRDCLESVFAECHTNPDLHVVIVDDATPDPAIRAHLDALPALPFLTLLRNPDNRGFVGAVNRALLETREGDILLLNADTIVPPGAVARLAKVAHAAPDIGTVTPMSNNGEFTSFPLPNEPNPLPSHTDILKLDQAARTVNDGMVTDIPNGIGFCLYVKSACLAAIGLLPEEYGHGYLEDADWCLLAREKGFRNVCAAAVFVGHAGSKSFGAEKRRLVVRNQKILEERYPASKPETVAFLVNDSLRPRRRALELALPELCAGATLLVFGQRHLGPVVQCYAEDLRASGQDALLLECGAPDRPDLVRLRHPFGRMPQSVDFDLKEPAGFQAFENYLRRLALVRIEIMDPRATGAPILRALAGLEVPFDIVIADTGVICPPGAEVVFKNDTWQAVPGKSDHTTADIERWHALWVSYGRAAARIVAPGGEASRFAKAIFPSRTITMSDHRLQPVNIPESIWRMQGDSVALAALAPDDLAANFIPKIAEAIARKWSVKTFLVLGKFENELELMRREGLIVIDPEEGDLDELFAIHSINCLVLCDRQPIFGHPIEKAAVQQGLSISVPLSLPFFGRFKSLTMPLPALR